MRVVAVVAVAICLGQGWLQAQQRPFVTEDPESIGAGHVRIDSGVTYVRDARFPLSGLRGHLTTVPSVGIGVGVGGVAEFQVTHVSVQSLRVTDRRPPQGNNPPAFSGTSTSSVDDLVVGAKVRIVAERRLRPSIGMRFATKLPNASTESGLGLDTMDFTNTVLVGKSMGPLRLVGNVGLGILSDPTTVARQNDVVVYGVSAAVSIRAVELVTEVNGHQNTRGRGVPPGTESSGHVLAGLRIGRGAIRVDGAVLVGVFSDDPSVGVMGGVTWIMSGFGPS